MCAEATRGVQKQQEVCRSNKRCAEATRGVQKQQEVCRSNKRCAEATHIAIKI